MVKSRMKGGSSGQRELLGEGWERELVKLGWVGVGKQACKQHHPCSWRWALAAPALACCTLVLPSPVVTSPLCRLSLPSLLFNGA